MSSSPPTTDSRGCPRVLLIGWDAAEWRVIRPLAAAGMLPHLSRLMERGESGHLAGGFPLLSPTRWTSIVTGQHPTVHGILGANEIGAAGHRFRPIGRSACNSPPIWTTLHRAGIACHAINFPATYPAEHLLGVSVSNRFFDDPADTDAIWPPQCAPSLRALGLSAAQIDAATVRTFFPQATDEDCRRDPRLRQIAAIMAHSASVHAAATWALQHVPWRFAAVCYTGLHQFSHGFMRFHPPRMPGNTDRDFELFGGVITAAYRFHDMMLGRLIELAGPTTRIVLVSDHGFQCDHLRPAPGPATEQAMLAWHRPVGMSVMVGPGIERSPRIRRLSIFNIAPTILGWFGQQMDDVDAKMPAAPRSSETSDDAAVEFLKGLGYVEAPDAQAEFDTGRLAERRKFYLAVAWLDAGRPR